ncbi:MAG: hypothetical protein M1142_02230, partial [Patescibacteria group bacterium]|nr:hypothetical protein [Patescibacteria group bacterium]
VITFRPVVMPKPNISIKVSHIPKYNPSGNSVAETTGSYSSLKRDFNKYKLVVAGMYLLSVYGWELASIFRSGYYFFRHLDDVLDGDRHVSCCPLSYAQDLRSQIETGKFKQGSNITVLAKHIMDNLEKLEKPGDDLKSDFLSGMDGLIFDYERSRERRVLTAQQVEDYYSRAFGPVVNIGLMALHPSLRSRDMPVLSYGQGRVYSVRDLKDDWTKGILNIPQEVLQKAALTGNSSLEEVQGSTEVQSWFDSELGATKPELVELQKRLKYEGGATNFIFGGLIKPMLKFIDKNNLSCETN